MELSRRRESYLRRTNRNRFLERRAMSHLPCPPCTQPYRHPGTKLPPVAEGVAETEWLLQLLSVSRTTLGRWLRAGKVGPAPVRVNSRVLRWNVTEVLAWVRAGMPERSQWEVLKQREAALQGK